MNCQQAVDRAKQLEHTLKRKISELLLVQNAANESEKRYEDLSRDYNSLKLQQK